MALTFADTHNMIAFLTKSDASEGFEQIIDFFNTSVIQYALIVNPTMYVSCIKQFWSSVSLKKTNDVVRLQALIDRRKVIITEDTVRQVLRLDDANSIDCLPNEEIFAKLARMGYKKPSTKLTFYKAFFSAQWKFIIHTILQCMSANRTAWIKFSSSMASAIIYLTTGRKFNFSKYIFDSLVRNVDIPSKFYMYLRFLQLINNAQIANLSSHTTKYTSPALTQKVFTNMRRVGKGFSGVDAPLFDAATSPSLPPPQQPPSHDAKISMTLLNTLLETCATSTKKVGTLEQDKIAQAIEITKLKQRVRRLEKKRKLKASRFKRLRKAEPAKVEEVIEVVTAAKLMTKVVTTATTTITASPIPKASDPRRRRGMIIQDPEEAATASLSVQSEVKSKDKGKEILVEERKPLKRKAQVEQDEAFARELEAELNANINWNEAIEQVKRKERQDNTIMRYQALKRKPVTKAHARKNMMVYLKNIAGFKMDFFKGMTYTNIRPIFEKHFMSIWDFIEKGEKEIEEEESKENKRKSENLEQKVAKKQKIIEEVEELKTHLQIIPNDEYDVYTEATPLALKVPVIDYQIHTKHNKPYYKIIIADGTYQLFLSFISLLRNFDREDLEMLWKIV
nr:hypothetical protein [Tanacetum cinerariifolium]